MDQHLIDNLTEEARSPPAEDKAAATREATAKRVREHRERRTRIGNYEYTGELLTYLLTRRRPHTGRPYITEAEVALGQSDSRTDRRIYDLALRGAITNLHEDLLAGRIA